MTGVQTCALPICHDLGSQWLLTEPTCSTRDNSACPPTPSAPFHVSLRASVSLLPQFSYRLRSSGLPGSSDAEQVRGGEGWPTRKAAPVPRVPLASTPVAPTKQVLPCRPPHREGPRPCLTAPHSTHRARPPEVRVTVRASPRPPTAYTSPRGGRDEDRKSTRLNSSH